MYQGDSLVPDGLPRRYQSIGDAEPKTRITDQGRGFFRGGAEDTKKSQGSPGIQLNEKGGAAYCT